MWNRQGQKRPLDTPEEKYRGKRERLWWGKHTAPLIPCKIFWTAKSSIKNAKSDDGNTKKYDSQWEREREKERAWEREKKWEKEEREKERERVRKREKEKERERERKIEKDREREREYIIQ